MILKDKMKARLEEKEIQFRGIVIESENEEEKEVLLAIWKGGRVSLSNNSTGSRRANGS